MLGNLILKPGKVVSLTILNQKVMFRKNTQGLSGNQAYPNNPYLFLAFKGGKWLTNSAPWRCRNLHHSRKQIPGYKDIIWNLNKITRIHKIVNTEIIYKIKQQTGDFILSQIMDILIKWIKDFEKMKQILVPVLRRKM